MARWIEIPAHRIYEVSNLELRLRGKRCSLYCQEGGRESVQAVNIRSFRLRREGLLLSGGGMNGATL